MDSMIVYLVPVCGIIGLLYTAWRFSWVSNQPAGDANMQKLSGYIADGAIAFLKAEWKILAYFAIPTAILLAWLGSSEGTPEAPIHSSPIIAIAFLIGAVFMAICFVYFNPSFLGKSLGQNDVTRAQSTQTEINDYKQKGETILWTNQIHAGMPTFQIWAPYPNNVTTWIVNAINYTFPKPSGTVLLLLFGIYLLFSVLKLKPWLAGVGAVAFTFSSYNIILMAAGHANQVFAIAFFGPVIAGIILIFRKEYLLGTALTALFIALEIRANHIQMTYYLMLALLMFVVFEAYHALKIKDTKSFFKSIGCAIFATLLAVTVNASSLWSTYEYGKETIRGKSNLTHQNTEPDTGLPKDYAYQWSQGVKECLTFLIPNAYGGSSRGHANAESNVARTLISLGAEKDQAANVSGSLSLYWGSKPFTEGPFYFGASVCFLFILGLLIVEGRMKWWLLAVIV
ncbi:MAG: hypothetical protein EOO85_27620, partial [Pedobacter sp.]